MVLTGPIRPRNGLFTKLAVMSIGERSINHKEEKCVKKLAKNSEGTDEAEATPPTAEENSSDA